MDVIEKVRILRISDPIPNDTLSFGKDFPQDVKEKIITALEAFAKTDDWKTSIGSTDFYGWSGIAPVADSAYDAVRARFDILGLTEEDVFNPKNDAVRYSWDDLMEARMFSSYVIKESNVFDRRISEYASGVDALMESERVKNDIFEKESFMTQVMEYARKFCPPNKAAYAVGRIKRAVQSGWEVPLESGLAMERENQQLLFESDDAKEGIASYVEKRPAKFTGK